MDDMQNKMSGAERLTKWSKKFLNPCLAVPLLSAALLLMWSGQAFSHPFEEYSEYNFCMVYFHLVSEDEFNNDKWLKIPSDWDKNKKLCILQIYYGNPYSYNQII